MTALSIQPTYPIFTDIDGQPLEDGYIWIGVVNLAPIVNPITVYWDAALTIPAAQPIRTRGGYPVNSGTPARLYVNSDYSIQVQNKNGSVVYNAPSATERYSEAVITTNAIYLERFGAVGDWSDATQTGTDDTAAIIAAFAAASALGYYTPVYGSPGKKYRFTGTLSLSGIRFVGNFCSLVKDFAGIGLDFTGGPLYSYMYNTNVYASQAHSASDYVAGASEHGIRSNGTRLWLENVGSSNHKGAGIYMDCTLLNCNKSQLTNISLGGNSVAGIYWYGGNPTPDNTAVIPMSFTIYGNYGYAFYADANSALRANDIWLYAENNGLGASFPASTHTVTILRAAICRFWAYVEEQTTGREMRLGPDTSNCFVYSTRRNTDIDEGAGNLWQYGQSFYRPDGSRMTTVMNMYGEYARVSVAGEYVQMPIIGSGGTFGYLRGTGGSAGTQKLQLMSEDLGSYLGIQDDLAFTNETFSAGGALVSGEKAPTLASATQSSFGNAQVLTAAGSTVTLFTLPSTDSTTAGRVYVSCESSGGVKFSYIFDIYISNSVFTVINAATGNSQATTTATLQKTGANIELVMTYTGGVGSNVRVFASGVVNAVNY